MACRFCQLFWISSAPLVLRPILALIEVISYFVRPVSHSIRLAGNMMAGHAVIKVFAAFAAYAVIAPLSVIAHHGDLCARGSGVLHPGLCLCNSDVRVSERRACIRITN